MFGPDGADWLLRTRPSLRGDMLICGEGPGSMGLAIAEKGVLWLRVEAEAPAGQGMLTTRAVSDAALRVRGASPSPVVRLPGSNASRWRALGVPAVCYGPQPTPASGPDDYVLAADLMDCARVYADAVLRCLSMGPSADAACEFEVGLGQLRPPC